jgi:hypothetical protein
MESTLTFDEEVNGWTSFFSYKPEFMISLNGKFFSFKNGDLFLHNSKNVPRNNFYGEQFTSKVGVVLNDNPSTEKVFRSVILEGNKPWETKLSTNLTEGEIYKGEFEQKQSRFFAYTRRNEDSQDLTTHATNGIGRVKSVGANSVFFNAVGDMINVGDKLTQLQAGMPVDLGIITSIDRSTGEVSVGTFDNPASLDYCYATKNSRVEGGNLRGYYMRADLENAETDFVELFAIKSTTNESVL